MPVLLDVLSQAGDDPLIPAIVWQNLQPLVDHRTDDILNRIGAGQELLHSPAYSKFLPHLVERVLEGSSPDPAALWRLFQMVSHGDGSDMPAAKNCLVLLSRKVQNHELAGQALAAVRAKFQPELKKILAGPRSDPLWADALVLAASWKDPVALDAVRATVASDKEPDARRIEALGALVAVGDAAALDSVGAILAQPAKSSAALRAAMLGRWAARATRAWRPSCLKTMRGSNRSCSPGRSNC